MCYVSPDDPTDAVLEREFTPWMLIGLLPLIFFFVGAAGLMWCLTFDRQSQRVSEPDTEAPWLQQADWAAKRILYSTKPMAQFAMSFAVLWNLVALPILLVVAPEALKPGKHLLALGLIFPAVGLLLIAWACRAWRRWKVFGDSVFELGTLPGVVGGALEGTLRLGRYMQTEEGFLFRLVCINRVTTGGGKDRSTSECIVWLDEHVSDTKTGEAMPVSFYIPSDCRETNSADSDNVVFWRLEVTARADGSEDKLQFEVPVFKVALTPEHAAAAQRAQAKEQAEIASYRQPANSRILVRPSARGGKEFFFRSARNPGSAAGLTVFLAVWSVVVWFLIKQKAPLVFPIVFGSVDLVLVYCVLQSWFGTRLVVVEPGRIMVTARMLGIGRTHTVESNNIDRIMAKVGMADKTTAYQDIKIVCRDGREITAGTSVRDILEAEWLAAEMAKAADHLVKK